MTMRRQNDLERYRHSICRKRRLGAVNIYRIFALYCQIIEKIVKISFTTGWENGKS